VSELDLASPPSEDEIAAVEQELVAHQVLFFRDQYSGGEQQLALGHRLGVPEHGEEILASW